MRGQVGFTAGSAGKSYGVTMKINTIARRPLMPGALEGMKIAILATDMVEESELAQPRQALLDAGAMVEILSPKEGEIQSFHDLEMTFGQRFPVAAPVADSRVGDYDALHLPGGVGNPDRLRIDENAITFVSQFVETGKPVGVICHGPWTLVEANALRGRTITSWPSLQTDIINAGGMWVDEQVVEDGNIVSSRKPADIPAFNERIIAKFGAARTAMRS
jgi:protease I